MKKVTLKHREGKKNQHQFFRRTNQDKNQENKRKSRKKMLADSRVIQKK